MFAYNINAFAVASTIEFDNSEGYKGNIANILGQQEYQVVGT